MRVEPATVRAAFILAGGKSARMGEDKAALKLDGRTLLEIALQKAKQLTDAVRVVGPREKFGHEAVEDVFPNCGPLGGIHAALVSSACQLNLILAVDTPFVTSGFLRFLMAQAQSCEALVTVPRSRDGFQPLCAVYRKSFADLAEVALKQGQCKIDALFPRLRLRVIEEEEMRRFAFDAAMFQNLNTRAEYESAQGASINRDER